MQLSNQKLVDRGMRMIMEELQLDEKKAKQLLQKYGSVKKRSWTFIIRNKLYN